MFRKFSAAFLSVVLLLSFLAGCAGKGGTGTTGISPVSEPPASETPVPEQTTTEPPVTEPPVTLPEKRYTAAELFPVYRQTAVLDSACGPIPSGAEVEVIKTENLAFFSVLWQGTDYRVPWDSLTVTVPVTPLLPPLTDDDITAAAEAFSLSSETGFLLWTDLWRLRTYVFEKEGGGWKLLRSIPASVGDLEHPTPGGTYQIRYHEMFLGKKERYLCKYTLQFYADYLYHSILLDWSGGEALDGRIGERVSLGCIRHSLEDSQWLYDLIPDGTTVFIR